MPAPSRLSKKEQVCSTLCEGCLHMGIYVAENSYRERPQYDAKLCGYLEEYDRAFIVHADNVGSKQFMDIRAVCPPPPFRQSS